MPTQKKLIGKELPFIDDRYRSRSLIEGSLVDVMEKCWIYNPEERIDIFEAVRLLRAAKEEHLRRETGQKEQ